MEKKKTRLFKITCDMHFCFDAYERPKPWDGIVILYEDGYFEGIPYTDKETRDKDENLIFGAYIEDKILDVTMIDKEHFDSSFHVSVEGRGTGNYFGDISAVNRFGYNSIGSCDLTFGSIGCMDFMTDNLEMEVCYIKNKLSNNDNFEFYQATSTTRGEALLKELLDVYETNPHSQEVKSKKKIKHSE